METESGTQDNIYQTTPGTIWILKLVTNTTQPSHQVVDTRAKLNKLIITKQIIYYTKKYILKTINKYTKKSMLLFHD